MQLVVKKITPLIEAGALVLLDPTQEMIPLFWEENVHKGVVYKVRAKRLTCNGFFLRLERPDGSVTKEMSLQYFIPKPN